MYPFERFNEDAKKTLILAQGEAERSQHSYIGTEHLLLGLLRLETSTANRVLTKLGVSIEPVRDMIKLAIGRKEQILTQSIIPTSRVKVAIELSFGEARRMGMNFVDTGHLLIGLVMEAEGIAAHVLADLGATQETVVPAVERQLGVPKPTMPAGSAAELMLRLLSTPAMARLLRARGVDTDALSKELRAPPARVVELQDKLTSAHQALSQAVTSWEYERAATLREAKHYATAVPYAGARLTSFVDPWAHATKGGYQSVQDEAAALEETFSAIRRNAAAADA